MLGRYPGLGRSTQLDQVRMIGTSPYPYLIYYRVEIGEVTIVHVRDGRRNIPPHSDLK